MSIYYPRLSEPQTEPTPIFVRVLRIGFMLMYLFVALALIAPKVFGHSCTACIDPAKSDEATMASELHEFRRDCGRYPATEEGLDALLKPPAKLTKIWKGPYMVKRVPLDPWGHRYAYRSSGEGFTITSYGADGLPGGNGEEADIVDNE